MENSRFKFRAYDETYKRFLYRTLIDSKEASLNWEQCTGLKDKNGKPIYENDIVTDGEDTGHIFWEEDLGAFAVTMFLFQKRPNELEVIGNIHENYELLDDNKIQAKDLDNNKISSSEE